MNQVYRKAASVLALRPCQSKGADHQYDILLVHKPRKNDAWQLPQGGVEQGETVEEAAIRELGEETGITNAEVVSVNEQVYQYDFPPSYRRFRPDNVCGQQIAFITARIPAGTAVQVDNKEVDAFVWVHPEKLGEYIKRPEYRELVEGMLKEVK